MSAGPRKGAGRDRVTQQKPKARTSTLPPLNTEALGPELHSHLQPRARSLQSKGLSRVFCNTTIQKQILWCSAFFIVQLSHPYTTTGKTML